MPEYVSNTSPILHLGRIGHIDKLGALLGRVIVPGAVGDELAAIRSRGVEAPDVARLPWAEVWRAPFPRIPDRAPAQDRLGAGENEVIDLGRGAPADRVLILDDLQARSAARALGLQIVGTVALIVRMRERNLIEDVGLALDRLEGSGFRISTRVRDWALSRSTP